MASSRCSMLGGADDRRGDAGLLQQPGERDLRRLDAAPGGDCGDAVDHGEVARAGSTACGRSRPAWRALVSPLLAAAAVAGEEAAGQRAPGDDADALVAAEREHLALFLAIDEVVVVLHRDEAGPARGGRRV